MRTHGREVALWLVAAIVAMAVLWWLWSRRPRGDAAAA
jgi:hypothetical protein